MAERFAYGICVLRPFPLETISLEFDKDFSPKDDFIRSRINVTSLAEWDNANDLKVLAEWLNDSGNADFLMPIDPRFAE